MIRKFNTRLLFTDTDSLFYQIHGKSPNKKIYKLFDLSNYAKNSKYYCSDNKRIVGKMKDEYGGSPIIKFGGLKSILDENNNEKSTNKGHNAFLEYQEFYHTLFQIKIIRNTMRGIKSKNHDIGTYESNKASLSCFDNKRYVLKNGSNTLAYGHKDIPKRIKSKV